MIGFIKRWPRPAAFVSPCPDSRWGHDWQEGRWSRGFAHQGSVGDWGKRCFHCGAMKFETTDLQFLALLPEWLQLSADLKYYGKCPDTIWALDGFACIRAQRAAEREKLQQPEPC